MELVASSQAGPAGTRTEAGDTHFPSQVTDAVARRRA